MDLTRTVSRPLDLKTVGFRIAMVCVLVLLLALSSAVISKAVIAGVGLVALGLIAGVGVLTFSALPLLMQKLENRILALRKAEARKNPVEQLQNDCLRRAERLNIFRKALINIGGQIGSMSDMLEERRHDNPGQRLERQERALERMGFFYEAHIGRLKEANAALATFQEMVKQKEFEWRFASLAGDIMRSLNPREAEKLLQNILTDEALMEVQQRFNAVYAELDIGMRAPDSPAQAHLIQGELDPLGDLHIELLHTTGGRL
ncbi:MAG: hypothetical protein ACOYNZ_19710 [Rhodoferax sp.]